MPRSSRADDDQLDAAADDGSASIEFLTAGLLLLVPIIYLVILVAVVQSAALATEGAARQAARVFVQAPSVAAGEEAAVRALELALDDHGVSAETRISITCSPDPDDCLARRSWVTVSIDARVPLPLLPSILDVRAPGAVPIEASATQRVSRFRDAP